MLGPREPSHVSNELATPRAATLANAPGRFRFSMWRNVTVTLWTDQATLEAAESIMRVSRRLAKEFPGGRSTITIISAGAPAPVPAASELFAELYKAHVSRVVCMGVVLEGSGFWASRMRSLVTSLRMTGGNEMALRVEDDLEALSDWLPAEHLARTGESITREDLLEVLRTARFEGT